MIVECNRCRSRYRMNPSILKGFQGAEVRCRKCGGTFVILVPGNPSGTGSPVEVAEEAVRHGNPPSPPDPGGPSAPQEIIPPEVPPGRPLPATGNADLRDAVLEEVSARNVPGNVYSLSSYREDQARRVPARGFDISGSIRPEPALERAEPEPAEVDSPPAEAFPKKGEPDPPTLVDWRMERKEEGIIASTSGVSRSAPGVLQGPTPWVPGPSTFQERLSEPIFHRFSHVALVYLALLFIGGCGYLVLSLFNWYFSGGGK